MISNALKSFTVLTALSLLSLAARAVDLEVTVTLTSLNRKGFVEFKAESDQKGEKATGHLKKIGETKIFRWNMGNAKQNIWFWWDTLDGEADLKIVMTGAPSVPVTLFEAHCSHQGKGEVQVGKTLSCPLSQLIPGKNHYRLHNPGLGPHLVPNKSGSITHVKDCDAQPVPIDPPANKGGHEWDLIWE